MREINLKEQNEMKSLIEKKRSIFIGNKRVEINTPERKIGSILKKSDKYQKDQNKIEEFFLKIFL